MKKFAVISHTHWDREWYKPFEIFRTKLVRLIDEVLEIISENKNFIFHLDAQTVVLEDYFEIRPENEEIIKKYVTSGNIVIGPWYLQNDFYLTSGEATMRNLLYGGEIAEKYGKCSNVGYMPDQFGIISAMPQILSGFKIRSAVFGRGYMYYTAESGKLKRISKPPEFIWKGEDGSEVLGVFLQRWYNNAQRLPEDTNALKNLILENEKAYENSNAPVVLLMNGVDHLFPQKNVLSVIDKAQEFCDIKQYRLDDYIEQISEYFENNPEKIEKYSGALDKGTDYEILKGCRSSRIYLKQQNVKAQDLLENKLEPLYSYLELKGMKGVYPFGELKYLWKSLLKLHPHDNICGCSTDAVHKHMEIDFEKIENCGTDLLNRGMEILARHTKLTNDENAYVITVFNPTERDFCGVVETHIDIPVEEKPENIKIVDGNGNEILFETIKRKKMNADYYSDYNLPVMREIYRYYLLLNACVNAYSYSNYTLVKTGEKFKIKKFDLCANEIENNFYIVGFDGCPYIIDKRTQNKIENPFYFEYSADCGDSYVYRHGGEPVEFKICKFSVVENSPLKKSVVFEYRITCPEKFDFKRMKPSNNYVSFGAKLIVGLYANSSVLEIKYVVDNKACDCRLRLAINGGLSDFKTYSDEPFNYLERTPFENCAVSDSNVHHDTSFINMRGGKSGVEIYTSGEHEFEIKNSTALITLLRATGVITRNEFTFKESGEGWRVFDNQVNRKISGKIGLRFCENESFSSVFVMAKQFRGGMLVKGFSVNKNKFLYGNATLQTSTASDVYSETDKYENLVVDGERLFKTDNSNLVVTAFKKSENKDGVIVRLLNFSCDEIKAKIETPFSIKQTSLSEKERIELNENEAIIFSPKQIKTYVLCGRLKFL